MKVDAGFEGIRALLGLSAVSVPALGVVQVTQQPATSGVVSPETLVPLGVVGALLFVTLKVGRELERLSALKDRVGDLEAEVDRLKGDAD